MHIRQKGWALLPEKTGNTVQIHYKIKILLVLHICSKDSWGNVDILKKEIKRNPNHINSWYFIAECHIKWGPAAISVLSSSTKRDHRVANFILFNGTQTSKVDARPCLFLTAAYHPLPAFLNTMEKNTSSIVFPNSYNTTRCSKPTEKRATTETVISVQKKTKPH